MKLLPILFGALVSLPHFEQKVGSQLPLAAVWRDEAGRPATLGSCLQPAQPAVVVFGYYRCAQLCSVIERSTVDTLRSLRPSVGRDYTFIYLSIDPTDTPEAARGERAAAIRAYGRGDSAQGWHYLTGGAEVIAETAAAAGFQYRYDAPSKQYEHPAGFLLVTPSGIVARDFFGIDAAPDALAGALRRAGEGRTGPSIFAVLIECFHGGIDSSPRERVIWDGIWAAVSLTVVGLGGFIGWMLHEERRKARTA
ncbi:MAG TPA: SCO family protein [Opitutaceae bacterium]|jgi:protein SCO1/2